MTTLETDRRKLLKLCGLGAAYGSTLGLAGATDTESASQPTASEGTERIARSPAAAPLGPKNVRLETERGTQPLTAQLLEEYGPGEILSSGVIGSTSTQSGDVELGLVVSSTGQGTLTSQYGGTNASVPVGTTVDLWAGAYEAVADENDDTIPVALPEEELDLVVETPGGSTDEFSLGTDEFGKASLTYELTEPGTYEMELSNEDVPFPPTAEIVAGPSVSIVTPAGFEEKRLLGRETTLRVLAREGTAPVEGVQTTARIEQDGSTIMEETLQTGEDGFASLSLTPQEQGTYMLVLERDGEQVDTHEFQGVETTLVGPSQFDSPLAGHESFFGGYLYSASGPLEDTEFDLRFEGEEGTVLDRTVQTDENGLFGLNYELPADIPEATGFDTLSVVAEYDDGTITPMDDSIGVNQLEGDDFEPDPIQIVIEGDSQQDGLFSQGIVPPGGTATVTVTVSQDDTPVTETDIDLAFQYGRSGPLFETRTVTTDSDGTATVTLDIPENAPDGATLSVTARGEIAGETTTNSGSGTIQVFELPLPFEFLNNTIPAPGEQGTVELEATDLRTDQPAAGQHRQIDYQYENAFHGSFATVSQTTGEDGTAENSFQVGEDVQFLERFRPYDAYYDGSLSLNIQVDHPGELSIPETVSPGAEIEISFDTPGSQPATGILAIGNRTPEHTFGTTLTSDEPVTLQIPDHADDSAPFLRSVFGDLFEEDFLPVVVWARGSDGTLYGGRWRVSVDADGDGEDGEDGSDGEDGGGDGPGFGLLTGLAGLGASGYLAAQRLGEDENEV